MEKYIINKYKQGECEQSKAANEASTLLESQSYMEELEDETPSYILGYN